MDARQEIVIDQPLPDGECWIRVVTNTDHITPSRTVHYQAFKGKAFAASDPGKSWAHELSGRVVSRAGSAAEIVADGERRVENARENLRRANKPVPSKISFVGVMCARATQLRAFPEGKVRTDVLFTPIIEPAFGEDPAHSDVVTYNTNEDADIDSVRNWLMKTVRVIETNDIAGKIESLTGRT
jgi:hypothetical protein